MPHHYEGYISKRIANVMDRCSVLDFAQTLHEAIIGSSEVAEEQIKESLEVVNFYIKYWTPSENKYDNAVLALLQAVIEEYYNSKKNKKVLQT